MRYVHRKLFIVSTPSADVIVDRPLTGLNTLTSRRAVNVYELVTTFGEPVGRHVERCISASDGSLLFFFSEFDTTAHRLVFCIELL